MDSQRKKRGENWSPEEKDILRRLICTAAKVLEDKSTKTYINKQKINEWKNLTTRHNKITGKKRTVVEVRLAWKRMKMAAKKNLSEHSQEQFRTFTTDFEIEINGYDCDAVPLQQEDNIKKENLSDGESCNGQASESVLTVEDKVDTSPNTSAINQQTLNCNKGVKNRIEEIRGLIGENNINIKERYLEMLETEHELNVQIAKLKIKKLQLEIDILQAKHNVPNVEI